MTNEEKIKTMTDYELAMFLCNLETTVAEFPCMKCPAREYCRAGRCGFIDWLKEKSI